MTSRCGILTAPSRRYPEDSMRKILAMLAALALPAMLAVAPISAQASSNVVGTYHARDLGQGGWAGGPLYADGSLGGGGGVSFLNGAEVGVITSGNWWWIDSSDIGVCLNTTATKDPLDILGFPFCVEVPVNAGPVRVEGGT